MKKKILSHEPNHSEKIKVRLDHRTMIVINKLSSLDVWKERYPDAKVIH